MIRTSPNWLEPKPFERRIPISALTPDPIGFAVGYLLAPSLGIEPLVGGVYGLVAASLPLSVWVMRRVNDSSASAEGRSGGGATPLRFPVGNGHGRGRTVSGRAPGTPRLNPRG